MDVKRLLFSIFFFSVSFYPIYLLIFTSNVFFAHRFNRYAFLFCWFSLAAPFLCFTSHWSGTMEKRRKAFGAVFECFNLYLLCCCDFDFFSTFTKSTFNTIYTLVKLHAWTIHFSFFSFNFAWMVATAILCAI